MAKKTVSCRNWDTLVNLMERIYLHDQENKFVEKMGIAKSTFYRWLNHRYYPCLANVKKINRAMRTKMFLNLDYNILPE